MTVIEKRNKSTIWKLKQKALRIIYHLVSGFGWSEYVIFAWQQQLEGWEEGFTEWNDDLSH
jgi:hypothetical protein